MGGTVNVAIRFRDGRAVCTERWTNPMPFWMKTPRFIDGDEAYVQEYLDATRYNDFVLDPYAPGRPVRVKADCYGLVVWDFMTGWVLDNNGYSSPDHLDVISYGTKEEEFGALAQAGKLILREYRKGANEAVDYAKMPAEDTMAKGKELYEADRKSWRNPDGDNVFYRWMIDLSPMTYMRFEEGTFKEYRAKLLELGFPMTRKEGLNAGLPAAPRKRDIDEREKMARRLYRDYRGEDKNKQFETISFDNLDAFYKDQFFVHADRVLGDPEEKARMALRELFGG